MPDVAMIVIFAIVGIVVGFAIAWFMQKSKSQKTAADAESIINSAKKDAETIRREAEVEAKDNAYKMKNEMEREINERKRDISQQENRLLQRENSLDQREGSLDKRSEGLDKREHQLSSMQGQLEKKEEKLDAAMEEVTERLEQVSAMTQDQAKEELISRVKGEVTKKAAAIIRNGESQARLEADRKARNILSMAIQRVAADHTSEHTISSVPIPSDDLKGRIIGREGRNIRTFEQVSGVSLVIDDTPETVVLSSFDPVRRETARVALENLIADGRIHPARIEEMYKKAERLVAERVQEAGEQAAFDAGIHDLHPELVKTLGALRYRTSFGQNVLQHSAQVSALCGIMACELGLDPKPAKRAGLLHDLGKAIDHEVEGPHAILGADLCRRYGERPDIVHAVEAHHADVEPSTVLDVLVQAADAISAARPGARRESAETYIKRLEKLEEISNAHDGVERTYAMQAGRELHVMVQPEKISDAQAVVLAHDIAKQIEDEMEYPGQVRVVVIRESRAVDVAK